MASVGVTRSFHELEKSVISIAKSGPPVVRLAPIARASNPNGGKTAEALYQQGSLRASYVHHYFASNPEAVAAFFAG